MKRLGGGQFKERRFPAGAALHDGVSQPELSERANAFSVASLHQVDAAVVAASPSVRVGFCEAAQLQLILFGARFGLVNLRLKTFVLGLKRRNLSRQQLHALAQNRQRCATVKKRLDFLQNLLNHVYWSKK